MANKDLKRAKAEKKDEFYTQLGDIQSELNFYIGKRNSKNHFKDKIVFCNCDDPAYSQFWFYFVQNFNIIGLKKLISTHYENDESKQSYKLELTREMVEKDDRYIKTAPKGDKDYFGFMKAPPPPSH